MSKALRLSEKRLHRGLWLVAIVFAWFLVGLGSLAGRGIDPRSQTSRSGRIPLSRAGYACG